MFVVHTVNQLEEAVRAGAGEILVTGCLVSNVRDAYAHTCEEADSALHRTGVPVWEGLSLMIITDQYAILDSHLETQSPCMILQRTTHH